MTARVRHTASRLTRRGHGRGLTIFNNERKPRLSEHQVKSIYERLQSNYFLKNISDGPPTTKTLVWRVGRRKCRADKIFWAGKLLPKSGRILWWRLEISGKTQVEFHLTGKYIWTCGGMRDRISREEGTLRWRTLTGEPRRSQVQVPKKTLKSKSLTKELLCSRAQIPRNNGIIKVFFQKPR